MLQPDAVFTPSGQFSAYFSVINKLKTVPINRQTKCITVYTCTCKLFFIKLTQSLLHKTYSNTINLCSTWKDANKHHLLNTYGFNLLQNQQTFCSYKCTYIVVFDAFYVVHLEYKTMCTGESRDQTRFIFCCKLYILLICTVICSLLN